MSGGGLAGLAGLSLEALLRSGAAALAACRAAGAARGAGQMNKAIVRAGWMGKRKAKGGISGWKRRFVVLEVDKVSYFKGPGEELMGQWELWSCVARLEEKQTHQGRQILLIDTPEGSYQLAPEAEAGTAQVKKEGKKWKEKEREREMRER